jgi:hypothetical protein
VEFQPRRVRAKGVRQDDIGARFHERAVMARDQLRPFDVPKVGWVACGQPRRTGFSASNFSRDAMPGHVAPRRDTGKEHIKECLCPSISYRTPVQSPQCLLWLAGSAVADVRMEGGSAIDLEAAATEVVL